MNRVPQSMFVAAAVLSVTILAIGCNSAARSGPSTGGPQSSSTSGTPASQPVEVKGLVVTVEIAAAPGPDITQGTSAQTPAPVPAGMSRLTIYSRAVNSTDAALVLRIEHNYPTLRDAKGRQLFPAVGGSLRARGIFGGKFTTAQEGLRPGGVFETVQSFDVQPGQTGLLYAWDFGDLGMARFTIP